MTLGGEAGRLGGGAAVTPAGASGEAAVPAESEVRPVNARPRSVLLVDDEDMVRKVLARMLEARGWEVKTASGGAEALRLFGAPESRFDLLVTDIMIPEGGGLELARRLVQQLPALCVLFVSGYSHATVDTRGIAPGRMRFLHKPFGSAELMSAIDELFSLEARGRAGASV